MVNLFLNSPLAQQKPGVCYNTYLLDMNAMEIITKAIYSGRLPEIAGIRATVSTHSRRALHVTVA